MALEAAISDNEREEVRLNLADVVSAQRELGDVVGARRTFALLVDAADANPDPAERNKDLKMAAVVLAQDDEAGALGVVERIDDEAVRLEAFVAMAAMLARQGQGDAAVRVLTHVPEGAARESALGSAARDAAGGRHYDVARAIGADLGAKPDAMIAQAASRAADFDEARRAIDAIQQTESKIGALEELGDAFTMGGRRDDAKAVLIEARDLIRACETCPIRGIHAKIVAEGLAFTGAFAEALSLVPLVTEADGRGELLKSIAVEQALSGDVEGAGRTVALIPRDLDSLYFAQEARASILVARVAAGAAPPSALDGIAEPWLRLEAITLAAEAARASGDSALAQTLLGLARDGAGDFEDGEERDDALLQIATAQAELGLVDELRDTAKLIEGPQQRADAYGDLGGRLAAAGDAEGARAAFAVALAASRGRVSPDDHAFTVELMAEAGLLDAALMAGRRLPRSDYDEQWARENALIVVAGRFAAAGRTEEALAIAGELAYQRVRAYLTVAGKPPY